MIGRALAAINSNSQSGCQTCDQWDKNKGSWAISLRRPIEGGDTERLEHFYHRPLEKHLTALPEHLSWTLKRDDVISVKYL